MNKAHPLDDTNVETVVSVAEMMRMYDASRAVARNSILGSNVRLNRKDAVDTLRGEFLTSEGAINAAVQKESYDRVKLEL